MALNVIDNTYYAAGGFTAIAGATQANIDGYTVAYRVASLYKDKLPLFAANAEYDLFTDLWTRGTLDPGDYLNAGLFPDPPTLPSAPVNSLLMFVSGTIPPNGTLLGVVKKGGIFHYCWQDA